MPYFLRDNATFANNSVNGMKRSITEEDIRAARVKYDSYGSEWKKEYFDEKSGGYNVYHEKHNFSKKGGGGEAEKEVGKMLAKYGKQVEFLSETATKTPDIKFDGKTWDIKFINKSNEETIRIYIKDARKADNAIFYWKNTSDKTAPLISAIARCEGYFKRRNELHTMPNIYYMDGSKLKLLWSK